MLRALSFVCAVIALVSGIQGLVKIALLAQHAADSSTPNQVLVAFAIATLFAAASRACGSAAGSASAPTRE